MNLISFNTISTARCHWLSWGSTSGTRKLDATFLQTMEVAIGAFEKMCPLGTPTGILCSGAYWSAATGGDGRHATGTAFDLTGLEWGAYRWRTVDASQDWGFYLALEGILRLHIPQVLDWWTPDNAHKSHWHLDDAPAAGLQLSSISDVSFLQACLQYVWGVTPGLLDGKTGPKTLAATTRVLHALGLEKEITKDEVWRTFLEATIAQGFGGQAANRDRK